MNRAHWKPEVVAAAVNGAIVMLIPFALFVVAWASDNGSSVSARVSPWYIFALRQVIVAGMILTPFAGFALVAGWRTWVHARTYRERGTGSWQGVLEAGGLGLILALLILLPASVRSPLQAPPYLIAYGGGALTLGLALGLLLRTTALLTLKLQR